MEGSDQCNFIFIPTKMYIDAAPERNPGAISSLHADPSTPAAPDTQPSTAEPSLPAGQGRQPSDLVMTASMIRDVPAAGILCRVEALQFASTTSDDTWVMDNFYAFVYLLTLLFT